MASTKSFKTLHSLRRLPVLIQAFKAPVTAFKAVSTTFKAFGTALKAISTCTALKGPNCRLQGPHIRSLHGPNREPVDMTVQIPQPL